MEKKFVDVIFDRRKNYPKKGFGLIEVRVYLGRNTRKYFNMGNSTPDKWEVDAHSSEIKALVKRCEEILSVMSFLKEELSLENFDKHFYEEEQKQDISPAEALAQKDFIAYCEEALAAEDIKIGTRKHKQVVIDAVKTYGKLKTYGDLTPRTFLPLTDGCTMVSGVTSPSMATTNA